MAMWSVLLCFSFLHIVQCSCPQGLELVREGECRGFNSTWMASFDLAGNKAAQVCNAVQQQPVIIHNDEHNSYWTARVTAHYFAIALICNATTNKWVWSDDSPVDYKPASYNAACELFGGLPYIDYYCTKQLPPLPEFTGECDSSEDDSAGGICYQENSFVRRLAVSRGALNGLILGATVSGKGTDYAWVDGTDWDYHNFYPGFPIAGLGDCLAMDTLSTSGEWMNIDCGSEMPVLCESAFYSECSSGPWKEDELIYSPGYPYHASVPCNYFLQVDAGKKVELKVQVLEANSCCDHAILTDNYIGGNTIAHLTGEITNTIYTSSTNFMRVTWQPDGGVNVRGMMFSYRGV